MVPAKGLRMRHKGRLPADREGRTMFASVMQSLPVTLLVEGGIFVTLAIGLRLSRRTPASKDGTVEA